MYIALFWVLKVLYIEGGGGSPQPPPMCSLHLDNATAAIMIHLAVSQTIDDTGINDT